MLHQAPSYGSAFPALIDWTMDSGASSHITGNQGNLTSSHSPLALKSRPHINVGNGSSVPDTATGTAHLTPHPFVLNDVLVAPNIVKNLISTCHFSRDNNCSVEFDPFGFTVMDFPTKTPLMRSNSDGDLYPFFGTPGGASPRAFSITTKALWHRRLGHPSSQVLSHLPLDFLHPCNKEISKSPLCEARQLGKHTRLPFSLSNSRASAPFHLIHCDLWTSPIVSFSGYKYYLVILDDYSHYSWTFPL
jgi:hypothetical protein